jgi:hypothetical protein
MNETELIIRAEIFLKRKNIKFIKPARIGQRSNGQVEIIFSISEALDFDVVDLPDVRV